MITSRLAVILLAVLVAAPCLAQTASSGSATAVMCVPARDKAGHIKRNSHQTVLFKRNNPCPANGATAGPCPGHVIDHIAYALEDTPDLLHDGANASDDADQGRTVHARRKASRQTFRHWHTDLVRHDL